MCFGCLLFSTVFLVVVFLSYVSSDVCWFVGLLLVCFFRIVGTVVWCLLLRVFKPPYGIRACLCRLLWKTTRTVSVFGCWVFSMFPTEEAVFLVLCFSPGSKLVSCVGPAVLGFPFGEGLYAVLCACVCCVCPFDMVAIDVGELSPVWVQRGGGLA